jgi:hypothetical protein
MGEDDSQMENSGKSNRESFHNGILCYYHKSYYSVTESHWN